MRHFVECPVCGVEVDAPPEIDPEHEEVMRLRMGSMRQVHRRSSKRLSCVPVLAGIRHTPHATASKMWSLEPQNGFDHD
jgi:hypothetical protein